MRGRRELVDLRGGVPDALAADFAVPARRVEDADVAAALGAVDVAAAAGGCGFLPSEW